MSYYILFLIATAVTQASPLDSKLGQISDSCHTKNSLKHVWVFKQWHLNPNVNTFEKQTALPQDENQKAIYKQLVTWITEGKIETIYSEGCSGEITKTFSKKFNGWDYKTLSRKVSDDDYVNVMTLVPLKLKVKFGDKVKVLCGDNDDVIKKQNEVLSDARGNAGFLARIEGFSNEPNRQKPYLAKVVEIDHLPSESTVAQVEKRLKDDLNSEITVVRKGIDDRNKSFEVNIAKGPKDSALIIGGIHAEGLKKLFQENQIDCTIIEPTGYSGNDEKAILNFLELNRK